MRDDPISRFLKRIEDTRRRLDSAPAPVETERPRGRGFGGSFDTVDLGRSPDSWSPQREFGVRPVTPGAQPLPTVETRAEDPSGRGLASAIAYRLDQPRRVARVSRETGQEFEDVEQQSMASFNRNRAPGEFEGGFSAGMDTAPAMVGLSVLPNVGPLKGTRKELENYMTTRITERARQVALGGGDPSSGRFMGGVIAGGALPTVAASGLAIGATATGIARTAQAAQALRGSSAIAGAIRGAGAAVGRSPLLSAYAASAGVTGLTTGEEDGTLTSMVAPEFARRTGLDKGAGAAVAEDFALNVAGDLGLGGVKRLMGLARKATDGTSQLLTREVKEQRAAEMSLDRGRQALSTYERISGVDPTTGQPADPTRQAIRDFWRSVRDAQNPAPVNADVAPVNAAVDAATPAGEPVATPKSMREILRENAQRGIGYGVAGLTGAEAAREMMDDEEQSGATPLAMAMTAAGLFGSKAKTANLGGRLTKVVDALGQAKVLSHGSTTGFDVADPKMFREGAYGRGYYWTEDSEVAGGSVRGMIRDWEQADGKYADVEGGYAGAGYHSPAGKRPPDGFFKARSEMIWADENLTKLEASAAGNEKKLRELKPTLDALRTQRERASQQMTELWPEGVQPNVRQGRAVADRVFDADERISIKLDRAPEQSVAGGYDVSGVLAAEFGKNPDLSRIHEALIQTHGPKAGDRFFEELSDMIGDNPDIEDMRRVDFTGSDVHAALQRTLNDTQMGGVEDVSRWTGYETRRSPDTNEVLKAAGYDAITHMDAGYMVNNAETRGRDRKARTWVFFGDETDQIRSPYGPAETAPPLATPNAGMEKTDNTMRNSVATGIATGAVAQAGISATQDDTEQGTSQAGIGSALAGAAGAAAAAVTAGSGAARRVLGRIGGALKRAPTPAPSKAGVPKNLPDVEPTPYRSPAQQGAAGFGKASPYGPMNEPDYLNYENGRWQELRNDPTGRLALTQRTQQLIQERGATFRDPVPFSVIRERADILGLDADEIISVGKKRGLNAEEQLAAADIVAQNMDGIVEYRRIIDDPATSPELKAVTERNLLLAEQQTNELLWQSLTARTEAGRNLAYQRIAAKRTMDPSFWLAQAGKNMGNPDLLNSEHVVQINRFIQNKDRMGLASYVASLKPGKTQRVLTTLYKAGLLTNPATYSSNIASNTLMAAAETAKDAPASLVDRIATSVMNSALGSPEISRSRDFNLRLAEASARGAKEGVADFKRIMAGKDPAGSAAMGKYDQIEEIRLGDSPAAKMAELYLNGPFRILRATDAPFKTAAFMRSLDQQRRLAGLPKADTLQDMMKGISADMSARAMADAEIATFQNKSALGTAAQGLKRGLSSLGPAGKGAAELLLPFTQTPGAVAGSVVRYSPLGLAHAATDAVSLSMKTLKARAMADNITAMASAGSANAAQVRVQREQLQEQIKLLQQLKNNMVDRAGRGAIGTAIMGLGMVMASSGLLTTKPGRTDRVQRDTGETMGDPGNTIDFGPLNAQIDRMAPIANLLLLGAYLVKGYETDNPEKERTALEAKADRTPEEELRLQSLRNQQEEDGARLFESSYGQAIATALGSIGSVIVEQPVFSGVSRVQDALNDPLRAAQQVGYSQIGSFIPAGVAAVARVTDDRRREAETLGETLRSRIPGLSRSVPEKLDALGEPIIEPLSVRVANLASPARLSSDRTAGNSESAMVRRLIQGEKITLSRVSQDKKGGETLREARDRQRTTGEMVRERLAGISQSDLQQMPKEMREDYLRSQISRARSQATRISKVQRRAGLFEQLDNVFDNR